MLFAARYPPSSSDPQSSLPQIFLNFITHPRHNMRHFVGHGTLRYCVLKESLSSRALGIKENRMRTSRPDRSVDGGRKNAGRFLLRLIPRLPHLRRCLTGGYFVAILFSLGATPSVHAQQATAQLTGTVRDTSGAVVVGATITLRNSQTNIARTLKSDKDGNYLFTFIPIGTYELTVVQQGFDKYVRRGITLEINQNAHLDVPLRIGTTSQVVEVTGDVTQVDTVSATLGKVETTQRILDLPLVERDTLQLGLLQAGVFAPDQDDGSGNPFSVSGQRSESMTFLLDGADNNDFLGNNIVVNPNPDAVAEFKILTNNYTAEYGRTSGGIVNQVIKSGTNSIHGSAFEFFRNTTLDASDYFLQQVPVLRRNIFGGTVGFPIKKDKLFFFASYQGTRRSEGQNSGFLPVLDQAERGGDFTELYTGQINPQTGYDYGQLFNPTTGNAYTCSGGATCNVIPVDPVIGNYISDYLPLPNRPNNVFISDPVAKISENQFIFRFDYNISSKDTLSGVYIFDDTPDQYPFEIINGASTGGDVPVGSGFSDANRYQSGNLTWTRTITPTLLNELRFATNRVATYDAVPTTTTSPAELGFSTVHPDDPKGTAPPLMNVTGDFNLGPSPQGPTKIHDTTFQYQDTLSWTHGRHDMKFGADLRWVENNFNFDFYNNGSFFFGQGGSFTGNTLADFVGGFFDNYYQFSNAVYGIRTHSLYFFGEDAWKATNRLTINYGLRYEYNSPQEDPHNEIMGWFPGQQSTVFPQAPPNFLYPGDPGTPNRGMVYPDRNNFAPRFGFAWDMLGNAKLVMRGGAGIFYDIEDGALNLQFGGQPPFGYVANNYPCFGTDPTNGDGCLAATSNGSFVADPFQNLYSDPFPFAGKRGTFFTPAMPFAYVTWPHFRTPYAENFNFGFQYQLDNATMIEAVYVGSLGRKAIGSIETNYPLLSTLQQQYLANGYSGLNPECARPLAACDSPLDPAGVPTGAQQIFTNISDATSSSNQFQLEVDRRLSHGVQFRLAYTNAKTIDDVSGFRARSSTFTDPTNPGFDRGLADFDAPQRLVISPIWQVPWDRPFKNNLVMRKITEGWTVATIASFQSGNPFTLFSENNSGELDNYLDRPDVIGPVAKFDPRSQHTFSPNANGVNGSCLPNTVTGNFLIDPTNIVCSVGPPVGVTDASLTTGGVPLFTHGNIRRNAMRGPGINNWDFSIQKDFKFMEDKSIEFRSEFFNAFNHAQFYSPTYQDGAIGFDSLFGQVSADRGPRVLQFALKIYY
jgi:Carboxypeptidase regulatory-like domain